MNKEKDADTIYNLLLHQLKTKLKNKECRDTTLKIALEFIRLYGLDDNIKTSHSIVNIDEFISKLPFKKTK